MLVDPRIGAYGAEADINRQVGSAEIVKNAPELTSDVAALDFGSSRFCKISHSALHIWM
jgi:hypothetical protein